MSTPAEINARIEAGISWVLMVLLVLLIWFCHPPATAQEPDTTQVLKPLMLEEGVMTGLDLICQTILCLLCFVAGAVVYHYGRKGSPR